jgi:23S rRNA pseudouridine1911/1915/1917 synthase
MTACVSQWTDGSQMNQGWVYREQVKPSDAGKTLIAYYTQRYPHSSESEWRSRIIAAQVLINSNPTTAETQLRSGQELTYHRAPWIEPNVPLTFDVLHEDQDLLILAKPSGLPVLPGGGFLEHTLLWQLQLRYPHSTPVPIHRLGRGTSGLMLMARSPLAKSHLSQQMRQRHIRKIYRTLVGKGVPDRLTLSQPIGKIPHPILGYIYGATPTGSVAHSECQVLKRHAHTTLLEVTILTGRPHQIRIHLAAAGYPLIGDPLYDVGGIPRLPQASKKGSEMPDEKIPVPGDCGYHLHAHQLSFIHPRHHQPMHFTCPVPPILIS